MKTAGTVAIAVESLSRPAIDCEEARLTAPAVGLRVQEVLRLRRALLRMLRSAQDDTVV